MRIRSGLIPFLGILSVITVLVLALMWSLGQFQAEAPPEDPYIGIRFIPLDPLGVQIEAVQVGSPAANAGLQAGDLIYTLDGMYIDGRALVEHIRTYTPQDTVQLGFQRNGEDHTVSVQLAVRPIEDNSQIELMALRAPSASFHITGIEYVPADNTWQVVSLDSADTLYAVGLREGDVITHVNGQQLAPQIHTRLTTTMFVEEIALLTVERDTATFEVEVPSLMARMLLLDAEPTLAPITE